jgi:hypothetical protein
MNGGIMSDIWGNMCGINCSGLVDRRDGCMSFEKSDGLANERNSEAGHHAKI